MSAIKQHEASVYVKGDSQELILTLQGELDVHTTAIIWQQCFEQLKINQPTNLIIDAKNLSYCDGAGINLLRALKQNQLDREQGCEIKNLPEKLQRLINIFSHDSNMVLPPVQVKQDWLTNFGKEVYQMGQLTKQNLSFTGEILFYLMRSIKKPQSIRWRDTWQFIEMTGPNALPIIALIGFLIGLIMGFQGAIALEKFGAKMFVPNFVGITLLRELAPLMTAIMVIGRSASAFAAELGNMRLNQEIDALNTMGLDATQFLVIPRVIATMTMIPFLNVFMILFGLIGCAVVVHVLGISLPLYINQLSGALTIPDFLGGMLKSFVFGIVVASIGCMHGLRTRGGAIGVGLSTTQTVVSGIVMLAILDGLFSIVFYSVGL